jgi:putative membrane protein
MHDRLSRLQGSAFDRAYMSDMVKDHDEDVRAFRREAQEGRDPALKQFAAKTLNVIEQHDKLARDVDRSLTATGSSRAPR